jgi:hypothetical protein
MTIAENWSRLRGKVEAWEPPHKAGDPGTLTIAVDRVDDVAASDGSRHRNMLSGSAGKTVRVTVPASAARDLRPQKGSTAILNVRRGRAPDRFFAHPEDIEVAPE